MQKKKFCSIRTKNEERDRNDVQTFDTTKPRRESTRQMVETFLLVEEIVATATPLVLGPFSGHLKFFSCLSVQKQKRKKQEKTKNKKGRRKKYVEIVRKY